MWIFDSFDFLCLKNKIITDIYKSLIWYLAAIRAVRSKELHIQASCYDRERSLDNLTIGSKLAYQTENQTIEWLTAFGVYYKCKKNIDFKV